MCEATGRTNVTVVQKVEPAVEQLVIWLPNLLGALRRLSSVLSEHDINIDTLVLTDAGRYGVVRIIVDNVDRAYQALMKDGFPVKRTKVLVLEISNEPGQLARVGEILGEHGINIEYLYGFPCRKGNMSFMNLVFIYTLTFERAKEALEKANILTLTPSNLHELGFFTSG